MSVERPGALLCAVQECCHVDNGTAPAVAPAEFCPHSAVVERWICYLPVTSEKHRVFHQRRGERQQNGKTLWP